MVDVNKILKDTVKKGKVVIGKKQTKQAIKEANAQLIVLANNCPYRLEINKNAKKKNIPIYTYKSHAVDLGYACGKNFAVSSFAILDSADVNIQPLMK